MAESHRIASAAFRLGAVFGLVAVVWSGWILVQGGSWWGPLHAFVAGTVLAAISGATQLFTVTWAAAAAPLRSTSLSQRWALAIGIGMALVGMATGIPWLVAVGAVIAVVALGVLAAILVGAIRRSLLRRFDLSSRFYLLALGAGAIGITLGGLMGSGMAGSGYSDMRLVHSHLNFVGLIGLTIIGTLPTILPTFAHHRVVSGREARIGWWLAVLAVVLMGAGLVAGTVAVGFGTLAAAGSLSVILMGIVGRLGRRGLEGGLAYYQVVLGSLWLVLWAVIDGVRLIGGSGEGPFSEWTSAVVTAGVGQVLLGSFAYLLPVLAGKPPRLGRNLDRMMRRPWLPLITANLAGFCFLAGWMALGVGLVGAWLCDSLFRLTRLEWRPEPAPV